MTQDYIQFKKQRELGDILNDTFKFLRLNFKPLFKLVLKMVWPFLLLLVISSGYYLMVTIKSGEGSLFSLNMGENLVEILLAYFFMWLAGTAYSAMLYGCIFHYIKSYIHNDANIVESDVIRGAKQDFGSLFGLMLLVGIMVFIGFALCFFPGIYLAIPLSMAFPLLVFDRKSISDSISESFTLIKDNWWITFATLLVVFIIIYAISFIFNIPALIYMVVKTVTTSQEGSAATVDQLFDWVYIALNLFSTMIQYLIYVVSTIATAFIFFNLKEQKYFTGTYETIDSLGKDKE